MKDVRKVTLPNEELLSQVGELIAAGNNVKIRVRGNSMNPFFVDKRDEVILSSFTKEDICPGKIVLARDEYNRFVLHRIIRIEGEDIILMGDGNYRGIEHTALEKIIAVAIGGVRKGKEFKCSGKYWEASSSIWKCLLPVRRWILAIWRRL